MDFSLNYLKKVIGKVSYEEVTTFLYMCERNGVEANVNVYERKIELAPLGLIDKWVLISTVQDTFNRHLLFKIRNTLSQFGVQIELSNEDKGEMNDFVLKLNFTNQEDSEDSVSVSVKKQGEKENEWVIPFQKHLNRTPISLNYEESVDQTISHTCEISGNVTYSSPQSKNVLLDQLAIAISSSLFHKLQNRLPIEFIHWISKVYTGENITQPHPLLNQQSKPVQQMHLNKEVVKGVDVFFNYHVLITEKENQMLVSSDLIMRNTGTIALTNPKICIYIDPATTVNFRGQIIPPEMVEGLGVQGREQTKGWKYVHEDWFEKGVEDGEYWIAPIQTISIPPGETIALSNFQCVIKIPKDRTEVTIDATVEFEEQTFNARSLNQMRFSFHRNGSEQTSHKN